MVGGGGGSYLSTDERYSGNKSHFKVVSRSLAEEDAFDLKPLRTGVRSGLLASIANLAKGALGGGILAGHVAYMTSGYVSGIILDFIYGVYLCFNFYILVVSAQRLCKRTQNASLTYSDCGEAAFALFPNPKVAKWSKCYRIWIDFITCLNLFGTCACYQLMVAKGMKQLVENEQETVLEGRHGGPSLRAFVAIMIIPTILICLIRQLKYLAPFSLLANAVIGSLCNVVYGSVRNSIPAIRNLLLWSVTYKHLIIYLFLAIVVFAAVHFAIRFNPSFDNLVPFTTLYNQVKFTGMSVFSLSCAGVVIPVENNMKEPNKFYIVIVIGYFFIISFVFLGSFFGYVAFTSHCESPITANFPMETSSKIMKWGIVIMIYITNALAFYMPFECVFYYIKKKLNPARYFSGELLFRALFVIIIGIVAIIFPNIDALMGFLGCFCLSNMAFICPNTIYVLVHYERPGLGKRKWRLWRSIALSLFGIFILICGSVVTGKNMVDTLFEGKATTTAATTTTAGPEASVKPSSPAAGS